MSRTKDAVIADLNRQQGSTKFKPGDLILYRDGGYVDVGTVVETPERYLVGTPYFGDNTVWADWMSDEGTAQADARDCTLLFPDLDRLRASNKRLRAALEDVAELLEFANLKMGGHGEGDGADHRADAVPIPGCASALAAARAALAESEEVAP